MQQHEGVKDIIASIHPKPKAAVLDMWGVVHDGEALYPGALEALRELKDAGVDVVFVSNTTLRAEDARVKLDHLGVPRELYKDIVTAGEAGFQTLKAESAPQRYYLIGMEERDILKDIPALTRVYEPAQADFAVACSFTPQQPTLADMQPLLRECAEHHLPMVCLNPDEITINTQGKIKFQAGKIAHAYRDMEGAGPVRYFGKPYPEVYKLALDILKVPANRVIAFGDSPTHDMIGGNAQGFTTVLVTRTGILNPTLGSEHTPERIEAACRDHVSVPHEFLPRPAAGIAPDPVPHKTVQAFVAGEIARVREGGEGERAVG